MTTSFRAERLKQAEFTFRQWLEKQEVERDKRSMEINREMDAYMDRILDTAASARPHNRAIILDHILLLHRRNKADAEQAEIFLDEGLLALAGKEWARLYDEAIHAYDSYEEPSDFDEESSVSESDPGSIYVPSPRQVRSSLRRQSKSASQTPLYPSRSAVSSEDESMEIDGDPSSAPVDPRNTTIDRDMWRILKDDADALLGNSKYTDPYITPIWFPEDDKNLMFADQEFKEFDFPRRMEKLLHFHRVSFRDDLRTTLAMYDSRVDHRGKVRLLLEHKHGMEKLMKDMALEMRTEYEKWMLGRGMEGKDRIKPAPRSSRYVRAHEQTDLDGGPRRRGDDDHEIPRNTNALSDKNFGAIPRHGVTGKHPLGRPGREHEDDAGAIPRSRSNVFMMGRRTPVMRGAAKTDGGERTPRMMLNSANRPGSKSVVSEEIRGDGRLGRGVGKNSQSVGINPPIPTWYAGSATTRLSARSAVFDGQSFEDRSEVFYQPEDIPPQFFAYEDIEVGDRESSTDDGRYDPNYGIRVTPMYTNSPEEGWAHTRGQFDPTRNLDENAAISGRRSGYNHYEDHDVGNAQASRGQGLGKA